MMETLLVIWFVVACFFAANKFAVEQDSEDYFALEGALWPVTFGAFALILLWHYAKRLVRRG